MILRITGSNSDYNKNNKTVRDKFEANIINHLKIHMDYLPLAVNIEMVQE